MTPTRRREWWQWTWTLAALANLCFAIWHTLDGNYAHATYCMTWVCFAEFRLAEYHRVALAEPTTEEGKP